MNLHFAAQPVKVFFDFYLLSFLTTLKVNYIVTNLFCIFRSFFRDLEWRLRVDEVMEDVTL